MNFYFRVDASLKIGTGHVVRCITLAKALRDRGAKCNFICFQHEGNIIETIRNEGFEVNTLIKSRKRTIKKKYKRSNLFYEDWLEESWQEDSKKIINLIGNSMIDWLIVDHYALDKNWEKELRPYVKKIMVIDDLADRGHDCDVLLDQNLISNQKSKYHAHLPADCTTLFGPKYALLQPEYAKLHKSSSNDRVLVKRIIIFFGGFDIHNLTELVLVAFLKLNRNDIIVDIIINDKNPNKSKIQKLSEENLNINTYTSLPSLASLMSKADLAVGACGSTTWERCCLGLPSIVITVAENQKPIAMELDKQKLVKWIGHFDNITESKIHKSLEAFIDQNLMKWSNQCKQVTDGSGASKVVSMLMLDMKTKLKPRLAKRQDEELLLNWANDPLVRKNAFQSEIISKDTHHKWFLSRLKKPNMCKIFIIETIEGFPIGQVRFEKKYKKWYINYSLAFFARGKKISHRLLKVAIQELKKIGEFEFIAEVKKSNKASCRAFEKNRFKQIKDHNNDFLVFSNKL